ncbi:MAG TPA: RDD family protein [Bryobacteraceae bacterium]|jgi:uncharacterized RDD family membrane protein YckC|nr:RDD family protein [Bryobacteraceae bacterium]
MTATRRQRLEIVTPEGVQFGLPLAGPGTRLLAWTVDALLIGAGLTAASRALYVIRAINSDWYGAVVTLAVFVISVGYGMFFEWWWSGQTPGKRMMRLRVVDAQGLKLEFHQIAIRNLMRVVDSLPLLYLVGGVAALVSRDAQRLGDMAANTVVIRQNRFEPVDPAAFATARYNSLLDYPHLTAVLRQKASPALVDLAMQAVGRRDELSPEAQAEVFGALGARFRAVTRIPEEVIITLTDEQFVRNILQVVTASGRRRT